MNLMVQISSNLSVSTHKLLVILVPNCFPFTGIHLRFNFQCTFPIYSLVAFAMWVNCQRVSRERRTTYHRKYERWGCLKLCRAHKPRGNTHTKRKATFKHVRILLCIIYSVYVYIVKCLSSFVFNKHNFEVLLLLFSIYNCLNFSIPTVRLPIPSQFTVVFFFFHLQSFSFIFFFSLFVVLVFLSSSHFSFTFQNTSFYFTYFAVLSFKSFPFSLSRENYSTLRKTTYWVKTRCFVYGIYISGIFTRGGRGRGEAGKGQENVMEKLSYRRGTYKEKERIFQVAKWRRVNYLNGWGIAIMLSWLFIDGFELLNFITIFYSSWNLNILIRIKSFLNPLASGMLYTYSYM